MSKSEERRLREGVGGGIPPGALSIGASGAAVCDSDGAGATPLDENGNEGTREADGRGWGARAEQLASGGGAAGPESGMGRNYEHSWAHRSSWGGSGSDGEKWREDDDEDDYGDGYREGEWCFQDSVFGDGDEPPAVERQPESWGGAHLLGHSQRGPSGGGHGDADAGAAADDRAFEARDWNGMVPHGRSDAAAPPHNAIPGGEAVAGPSASPPNRPPQPPAADGRVPPLPAQYFVVGVCEKCGVSVPADQDREHRDWHLALALEAEERRGGGAAAATAHNRRPGVGGAAAAAPLTSAVTKGSHNKKRRKGVASSAVAAAGPMDVFLAKKARLLD